MFEWCENLETLLNNDWETILDEDTGGWNRSLTKNTKNGTEREDHSLTKNGTEWYGMEREPNNWKTKERERNDLAEGHHSRTQRNGFKKVCVQP